MMTDNSLNKSILNGFINDFHNINTDVIFQELWSGEKILTPNSDFFLKLKNLIDSGSPKEELIQLFIFAKENNISKAALAKSIFSIAFCSNWKFVWYAITLADEIYGYENESEKHAGVFGLGELSTKYAQFFVGDTYVNMLTSKKSPIYIANNTLEPGCHSNWRINRSKNGGGRILICTNGEGWYQKEGEFPQSLKSGEIVYIPINIRYWIGAKKESYFSHLEVTCPGEDIFIEWKEPVIAEVYNLILPMISDE